MDNSWKSGKNYFTTLHTMTGNVEKSLILRTLPQTRLLLSKKIINSRHQATALLLAVFHQSVLQVQQFLR